ncbi:MAG: hypothetical protein K6T54_05310 [Ignavibacterium sp.]|nr:hypothetical protein [Ignavibacterium sp.]
MKYLIFLFVPVLIFSQNNHTDKLYLLDGKEYPCTVTSLDDNKISFLYLENRNESIIWDALDKLEIENFGIVYQKGKGFNSDYDLVKNFVKERANKILSKKNKEELLINSEIAKLNSDSPTAKKWSMGVLFVPYYSGEVNQVIVDIYPPYVVVYNSTTNEINMEWFLNFSVTEQFSFIFDFSYNSDYYETKVIQSRFTNYDTTKYGVFDNKGIKKLNIHLGGKFYFFKKIPETVNIFALAGFGRQFAFAERSNIDLIQSPGSPIVESNEADFLENINSLWKLYLGFGAEYYLNNSLSIISQVRFLYSSSSGKLNIRYKDDYTTRTTSSEVKLSNWITRIGLGLNFYF